MTLSKLINLICFSSNLIALVVVLTAIFVGNHEKSFSAGLSIGWTSAFTIYCFSEFFKE